MKNSNYFKFAVLMFTSILILFSACTKEAKDNAFFNSILETENLLDSCQMGAATYIVVLNDDFEAAAYLKNTKDFDRRKEVMNCYLNRYLRVKAWIKNRLKMFIPLYSSDSK